MNGVGALFISNNNNNKVRAETASPLLPSLNQYAAKAAVFNEEQ